MNLEAHAYCVAEAMGSSPKAIYKFTAIVIWLLSKQGEIKSNRLRSMNLVKAITTNHMRSGIMHGLTD